MTGIPPGAASMTDRASDSDIQHYLEQIANQGCNHVNDLLRKAGNGEDIEEISHLDVSLQRRILKELQTIMSVYTTGEADE